MRVTRVFLLLAMLCGRETRAQEMAVPVAVQFPLFLKVLAFDRKLKERAGDEVVFGIVYQEKFRKSLNVKDDLVGTMKELSGETINGIRFRYQLIDVESQDRLSKAISDSNVDVLYVTPLRSQGIAAITSESRAHKLRTITGVGEYVEAGLAVGIGIKGENPEIMVNLAASKAEGAEFSSQLLKLAKIVGPPEKKE